MKFYKIKEDYIINLSTIRTARVLNNEIYITFTCKDIKSERFVFGNFQAAADAFNDLCDALELR